MHPGLIISRFLYGSAASAHAWLHAGAYVARSRKPRAHRRPTSPQSPPRLLFLCRTFPPALDGGVYRLVALIKAARASGWEVDVVTREPPAEASAAGRELADSIPDGVRVRSWERPQSEPIARISPTIDGGFLEIDCILKTAREFPAPTVILASGPMFSEFVAARALSAETSAPYVLGYRDEWTTNLFAFVSRGITDRFWERFALSGASAIVCATNGMARELVQSFGTDIATRIHVIPNGWDPVPTGSEPLTTPAPVEELARSLGFFGTLTEDIDLGIDDFLADAEAVMASRPDLVERLRLRFVGRKSPTMEERLTTNPISQMIATVDHQPVSTVCLEMQGSLGLLLLNGPRVARAVPGKTYQYIAARRPILIYGKGGDLEGLLAGTPGTRMIGTGNRAELERALDELISGALERELAQRDEHLEQATSRAVRSREYLEVLATVAREGATAAAI
ncbi:MAG: glycosyltransferase [Gemmatimonadota bacterium]